MSIWGVNNSPPGIVIATAGGDVNCPAGAETNALGASVAVAAPGLNFAIITDVTAYIVLGATPPTALVIAMRQASGADYDSWTVPVAALTANAILPIMATFAGTFARNSLATAATLNLTVNPTGQAVTFKASSRVMHAWQLAPDA